MSREDLYFMAQEAQRPRFTDKDYDALMEKMRREWELENGMRIVMLGHPFLPFILLPA